MTIPSRPAPPPPNKINLNHHNNGASASSVGTIATQKKPAPPRPPLPRANGPSAPLKKIGILSNIFGTRNKANASLETASSHPEQIMRVPPKLPAPPMTTRTNNHHHLHHETVHHSIHSQSSIQHITNHLQLIDFDDTKSYSPPPMIKKSNTGGSDSVSIDSFCSSTSSPNLGAVSQSESGFEDDFSVSEFKVSSSGTTSRSTTFSSDPFDCFDDFSSGKQPATVFQQPTNIRNLKPTILPKPLNVGNANFYTSTNNAAVPSSSNRSNYDDTLCNGKNLIVKPTISMPTIIKPVSATIAKGKSSPTQIELKKTETIKEIPNSDSFDCDDDDDEGSCPSPPMPSFAPPPLPSTVDFNQPAFDDIENEEREPFGIALYDFETDIAEDLNFRANEKVYLIQQMNEEWMFGRNKRGCEGIFPISYVDVHVPLNQVEPDSGTASRSESVSPAVEGHRVKVLYTFNAETEEDLSIVEGEIINVIYEITAEWLYGANDRGEYGQFPANFIEHVPQNLPLRK